MITFFIQCAYLQRHQEEQQKAVIFNKLKILYTLWLQLYISQLMQWYSRSFPHK